MRAMQNSHGLDIDALRKNFPVIAAGAAQSPPLCYLDNGATTQKPAAVIERMRAFDSEEYATVHRGSYRLAEQATMAYEKVRDIVAAFIGAASPKEIVFTSGATQSVNLVAAGYGRAHVNAGDEIIISTLEHHANIVPWQQLCAERDAVLKIIPVDDDGNLLYDEYEKLLNKRTKIVAVTHVSNALGTVNRVKHITEKAHDAGAVVVIDGAQSVPHMMIDVADIGCDFYLFSAHKMYGPTGVGVLYGKYDVLDSMAPYVTGGDMIRHVTFEKSSFAPPPHRFEAGTPNTTGIFGFAAAIDYLESVGRDRIALYEGELLEYGRALLDKIEGVKIIGNPAERAGVISFVIDCAHPHDVTTILAQEGVALRGGHHCAQPTMDRFCVPATSRASVSFYNTFDELDRLAIGVQKVIELFS